jgi:DNA-binding NtrC family response regulator
MKILILDDDEILRCCMSEYLRNCAHAVDHGGSGQEVILRVEHCRPDVLISDVRLSAAEGVDFWSEVRGKFPDLPVILMTSDGPFDPAYASLGNYSYHVLQKPFDFDALQACLRWYIDVAEQRTCGADDIAEVGIS